jgi:hypothetical protein
MLATGETHRNEGQFAVESRLAPVPFKVGRDSISPVSLDYKSKGSFPFTGTIERVAFEVTPKN